MTDPVSVNKCYNDLIKLVEKLFSSYHVNYVEIIGLLEMLKDDYLNNMRKEEGN